MKRISWLILLVLSTVAGLRAQTRTNITIGANVTTNYGPTFVVDGTAYNTAQTFEWIVGTVHSVDFPLAFDQNGNVTTYQSQQNDNVRFFFNGWTANTNLFPNQPGNVVQVVADPSLTTLTVAVTVNYLVNIVFAPGTGAGTPDCTATPTSLPWGVIYVNQQCIADSEQIYLPGGSVTLGVLMYPGYAFYGYLLNGLSYNSLTTLNLTTPLMLGPQFSIAKRVDFLSNPVGLQVLVDGTPINTPPAGTAAAAGGTCAPDFTRIPSNAPPGYTPLCWGQFDFLPGSKHTIGAPVPQLDTVGNYWNFSGFSDGLGQNALYIPDSNTSQPDIITANFVPGVHVTLLSNPPGLKLMIDGRDNWQAYNFVWGTGEVHTIGAETPQTDAHNRVWTFTNWSDGGAVTHTITVPPNPVTGYSVTANYSGLAQITINTSPSGLPITIDGNNCPTPCVVNKANGSTSQITLAATIPSSPGSRFNFVSWSDGSTSPSRTVTFSQSTLTLTASYQVSFQLLTISNPAKGGTFKVTPSSPDGFYVTGTNVTVSAVANSGYKFAHWQGDLVGSSNSGSLSMTGPHTVQADFTTVPFIPPAGIQSVTGPTPDGTIAPGSLIAIYGTNLAAATQSGPTNPLAQTIGGITVTGGNFLLPLVLVSPTQIDAQIPWEMVPGTYELQIQSIGLPNVTGTFTVSAVAPGLFQQPNAANLPLVFALHPNGSLITVDSPAVEGEQVSIYGTGFGNYVRPAVDGFPASPVTEYTVAGTVTMNCGANAVTPDWAGAASGMVGVSLLKMTITKDMAGLGNATLTVAVNGKSSSSTILPIQ